MYLENMNYNSATNFPFVLDLHMFDANPNTNVTTQSTLSAEMKTFYDRNLIENASPLLVHDRWAQKRYIPKNGGKKIEFRKYVQLGKSLTPLTEGVTPDGQSLSVTSIEAEVKQYGNYVTVSDMLQMTTIDNTIVETTDLIGGQAGTSLDTISREVLNAGTNVQYAEGQVSSRTALTSSHKLTVRAVKMAVRTLKKQLAAKIDGSYWAIIHPDIAFDLTEDPNWIDVHKYAKPDEIFEGEIGKIGGVRFVETTEAKIFAKAGAAKSDSDTTKTDVYSTLFFGANAYATTKIEGAGLQTIVKQLGSGGTADPLDQRATIGWKATKVTEILSNEYMVRVETGSTFSDGAAN